MTIIVNPVAGPGAGKSTLAHNLFALMKAAGEKVEFVTEYAKELTYDEDWMMLSEQALVLREQERRQRRLRGKVDYVVTDSPLPVGLVYAPPPFDEPWFAERVWKAFDAYENFTVFVERVHPFQTYGRYHDEAESLELDARLRVLFKDRIDLVVPGDDDGPKQVYEALKALRKSV